MKIAVVILNWNGRKLLETFLPSVILNSEKADIYVIDNASTDDSVSFLTSDFPSVKIIKNDANYGFAKGYNIGLKNIEADIFCLLNSDVEVTPNWLQAFINLFENNSEIVAAQPKILDYKNKTYFEYAGAAGGFIDNLGYPFCRGRIFDHLEKDEGQYDDTSQIFWASGACFFIRKENFEEENGFDEDYFAHMEEIDLCWRLNNKNKKVYYCGKSSVYHLGGGTLKTYDTRKSFLNFRNSLFTLLKNLPAKYLLPFIFCRLCLDGISAIVFLPKKGFKYLWAIFHSHISFYYHFFKIYKKRDKFFQKWSATKFIAYQYFILKRREFTDLK